LVGHALGLDRAQLLSQSNRILSESEQAQIAQPIARRARHESVARIIGSREFWSLPFGLNEATLEPRPDSETLVEAALARGGDKNLARSVLDLGTGSGCLLLALLHEWPQATGLGIDAAPRAVEQAGANAAQLGMDSRANFQLGNWFDGITERFDVIISNPPYIAADVIAGLMPEVRDYDPCLALAGGADGLDAYRAIIPRLGAYLNEGGFVCFEVGMGQAPAVEKILARYNFIKIKIYRDLGGIERCLSAYLK